MENTTYYDDSSLDTTTGNVGVVPQTTSSGLPTSFYISLTLIWTPGTLLNTLALCLIVKDIKKAVFPAAVLLMLLCSCDLLAAMFSCARHMLLRYLHDITRPLCATLAYVYSFFKVSSGVVNCLMTLDRALAICTPFIYKRYITVRTWQVSCVVAACIIALYSAFPLMGLGDVMNVSKRSGKLYCSSLSYREEPVQRVYGMIFGILGIIFVMFIVIGNVCVIRTLFQLGRKVAAISSSVAERTSTDVGSGDAGQATQSKSFEIAVAKLMIGLASCYLICGTPYSVQILLLQFNVKMDPVATGYIHLLGGTIYTVDPIVYILIRKTARKRIMAMFCPCLKPKT